jgi:hypothetical protein
VFCDELGAVRASTAKALSREISSAAWALSRAFARSDEFLLEFAAKARPRGNHRRRSVSRHASLAQRVRVAPKAVKRIDAITVLFSPPKSMPREPRDGVDSSDTHVGATQLVHARPLGGTQFFPFLEVEPLPNPRQPNRSFVRRLPPPSPRPVESTFVRRHHAKLRAPHWFSVVRSRGRMSFHSNPLQKLAIAATTSGTAYRGTRVSRARPCPAKAVRRTDAIRLHLPVSARPLTPLRFFGHERNGTVRPRPRLQTGPNPHRP